MISKVSIASCLILILIIGDSEAEKRNPGDIIKKKCEEYSKSAEHQNSEDIEFPYMAVFLHDTEYKKGMLLCGGTLISEQYILTAAHCVDDRKRKTDTDFVKIGTTNFKTSSDNIQTFNISQRILHPDYTNSLNYNDIALIKLDHPVKITFNVKPLPCLYTKPEITAKKSVVSGFGVNEFAGSPSGNLRKILLDPSVSHKDCNEYYMNKSRKLKEGIVESQFCAAPIEGSGSEVKNTCQGDAGSPLLVYNEELKSYEIVGITSFGIGCADVPGVYTKVSSYIKWIEDTV